MEFFRCCDVAHILKEIKWPTFDTFSSQMVMVSVEDVK